MMEPMIKSIVQQAKINRLQKDVPNWLEVVVPMIKKTKKVVKKK